MPPPRAARRPAHWQRQPGGEDTNAPADGSAAESGAGSAPSSAPAGWTDAEIDDVLQAEIPPDAYFNARGIYGNYHGGNVLFEDPDILQWIVSKSR